MSYFFQFPLRVVPAILIVVGACVTAGCNAGSEEPMVQPLALGLSTADQATVFPALSISDSSVVEGDTGTSALEFEVARKEAPGPVFVQYAVYSLTAHAGTDFIQAGGWLSLPVGARTGVITIQVLGDTAWEGDERLAVKLLGADGAGELVDGAIAAFGTIVDDDPPSPPDLDVEAGGIKTLHFNWPEVEGATHFTLEARDGTDASWGAVASEIPGNATHFDLEIAVHLIDWVDTEYRLVAHNTFGQRASEPVGAEDLMLGAIGRLGDYGYAVAISADGRTLATGAPTVDGAAGAVRVFVRTGGGWAHQARLVAPNRDPGDWFGKSIALSADGNTLAVGAIREDGSAAGVGGPYNNALADSGAAYVFAREPGRTPRSRALWRLDAYVKASNPGAGDEFGGAVDLSDDGRTLAVGAASEDGSTRHIDGPDDDLAFGRGAVYVYARESAWTHEAYIKSRFKTTQEAFGACVSLSANGNTLAVGAPGDDQGVGRVRILENSGAAYVFTRKASAWSQRACIKPSNAGAGDRFGFSISLSESGTTLAVGALDEDGSATGVNGPADDLAHDSGAAYVFTRSKLSWNQAAYIKGLNTVPHDKFGISVALSGDGRVLAMGSIWESSAAVGVGGDPTQTTNSGIGAVHVFERSGSAWQHKAYVKAPDLVYGGQFGYATALSQDGAVLVVGAGVFFDEGVTSTAYVY